MTIASSTTKPTEMVSAISEMFVEAEARGVHRPGGRQQRQRHRQARDDGRPHRAQEDEITSTTRAIVMIMVIWTSCTAGLGDQRAVGHQCDMHRRRD